MSGDPLAIPSAHELMSRVMEAYPRAYEAFARAIAGADPGLGADFAWAVTHPEPDSLDAAWAEAVAALPEGWILLVSASSNAGNDAYACKPGSILPWECTGNGPTPAAALRALAAKLREVG